MSVLWHDFTAFLRSSSKLEHSLCNLFFPFSFDSGYPWFFYCKKKQSTGTWAHCWNFTILISFFHLSFLLWFSLFFFLFCQMFSKCLFCLYRGEKIGNLRLSIIQLCCWNVLVSNTGLRKSTLSPAFPVDF